MIVGVDLRPLISQRSGVGQYLWHALTELIRSDPTVQYRLLLPTWRSLDVPEEWRVPQVSVHHVRLPSKLITASSLAAPWPPLDRLAGGCDVFWLPNIGCGSVSERCPLVVTIHDCSFALFPELFTWHQRLWHTAAHPRRLCARAAMVVADSAATARDVHQLYGVPSDRLTIVSPGVPTPPPADQSAQRPTPERFLLCVGTREPRKNLAAVLEAFALLRQQPAYADLQLVIAGGAGWHRGSMHRLLASHPARQAIRLLGYVSEEQKVTLYRQAEALLYPSLYEGFGFPPLEAMAAGCPVITSLTSATSEVCGGAALLVEPYHSHELAAAVGAILSDSALRARLVATGSERVRQYSWARTADQLLTVFRRVARRH